jgi:hypothetical protein
MRMHHSFVNQLQFGLGVLVATTLLGLIAILVSEQRVDSALDRSEEALSRLDDFKEVQIQFSAARAAEREFLLEDLRTPNFFQSGDSPALERHRAALTQLDHLLNSLERQERGSDVQSAAIREAVDVYGEGFSEMVSLYRERGFIYSGRIEEMRRVSFALHELLEELTEASQTPLRAELLELIRDQGEYLRDLSHRSRFLVTERLKVLHEEIDKLDNAPMQELHAQIDTYQEVWTRLLEVDDRIGSASGAGLRGTLNRAEDTVVPLTLAAVEHARAGFKEAGRIVHNTQAMARLVSAGAVLLAVTIALLLAISLRTQVRGSLAAVLRAVEAYACGERTARVGTLSRRDEFAVLGESFDHMAETSPRPPTSSKKSTPAWSLPSRATRPAWSRPSRPWSPSGSHPLVDREAPGRPGSGDFRLALRQL